MIKLVGMYDQLPLPYQNLETHGRKIFSVNAILQKSPWQLPSKQQEMVCHSFIIQVVIYLQMREFLTGTPLTPIMAS